MVAKVAFDQGSRKRNEPLPDTAIEKPLRRFVQEIEHRIEICERALAEADVLRGSVISDHALIMLRLTIQCGRSGATVAALLYRFGVGFERRLMRQAGPYASPDAQVVAIDMALCEAVDPPGPVGVVVTDAEVLLIASAGDGGHLTKIAATEVTHAEEVEPNAVALRVAASNGAEREIILDFRYFGITDDTVAKLLDKFAARQRLA
jgi:hypothetical protein